MKKKPASHKMVEKPESCKAAKTVEERRSGSGAIKALSRERKAVLGPLQREIEGARL